MTKEYSLENVAFYVCLSSLNAVKSIEKKHTSIFYARGICCANGNILYYVKTAWQRQNKFVLEPNLPLVSFCHCDLIRLIKAFFSGL